MHAATDTAAKTFERIVRTYFRAKDENRPHLMRDAFSADAVLEMTVKTETISFPSNATGLADISALLVSQFNQKYENIYSFCLDRPQPDAGINRFSCDWLVGMTEKDTGNVRLGCGRYDWSWSGDPGLADRLAITIETMQVMAPDCLASVYDWLLALPYPWCTPEAVARDVPRNDAVDQVVRYLVRKNRENTAGR